MHDDKCAYFSTDGIAHLSGEIFPKRFPVYFHVGYDKRFFG